MKNTKRARRLIRKRKRLESSKFLGFVAHKLTNKSLWIANYDSVARGVFVGFFWMMIPLPLQMTPAIISAVVLKANIPTAISTVWISNPLTWVPMYLGNYIFGCFLLGEQVDISDWKTFGTYMLNHLHEFWQPLFLGSFVAGILVATAGFLAVYVLRFINHVLLRKTR
ncbi:MULTISPECIES: DUF2062 domain-containing protein [unclassified Francisella]|uniref:DUF2062 domain-containing protein n=1 Tax=unclassified Francisella TaxID=2610885 RepID=UPI002E2F9D68|nr:MULTISPECIES: DUF2062 domain-containing protein [unclassified Francisella]MED7819084.1 DUF2062 domain-containing protein [Francisella sp. 19S2-4]MED7829956.1 DUF2062 domain-containing protein [Francisella sp. 19S2-10]